MSDARRLFMLAALVGAVALWLLLPRSSTRGRAVGAALGMVSLGIFAALVPGIGEWAAQSLFWILASITVVSAAAAVTLRNPLYCAIWFGSSLLGTAGLFLFQGAQFLAVATVVVYAGAILVVFLFILMLAQPSGRARYDRISWEALLSTACGAFIVGVLSMASTSVLTAVRHAPATPVISDQERQQVVLSGEHMQHIGNTLFGRYLVAVEVAGALLFAALVGAAVIVGQARGPLVGPGASPIAETVDDPGRSDTATGWLRQSDVAAQGRSGRSGP
jgi:NADH-quinone oxidoreductase subunit J